MDAPLRKLAQALVELCSAGHTPSGQRVEQGCTKLAPQHRPEIAAPQPFGPCQSKNATNQTIPIIKGCGFRPRFVQLGNRCIHPFLQTGAWSDLRLLGEVDYLPYLAPLGVLGIWLLTYGLGEETGWRGFALPHLQRNRSAASATSILAVLWACWHLPAFYFRDTYGDMGVIGFPIFAFSVLFSTVVFTWLYNSTGGSLLLVVLFHAVFNWLSVSEAGGQFAAPIMTVPVILWALFVPRRYGLENVAPLRKQMA